MSFRDLKRAADIQGGRALWVLGGYIYRDMSAPCRLRLLWWEIVAAAVTYAFAALKDYPQNGVNSGGGFRGCVVLLFGTKLLLQVKFLIIFQSAYIHVFTYIGRKTHFSFLVALACFTFATIYPSISFSTHTCHLFRCWLTCGHFFLKINHAQHIK